MFANTRLYGGDNVESVNPSRFEGLFEGIFSLMLPTACLSAVSYGRQAV